jgi:hypothetical protein
VPERPSARGDRPHYENVESRFQPISADNIAPHHLGRVAWTAGFDPNRTGGKCGAAPALSIGGATSNAEKFGRDQIGSLAHTKTQKDLMPYQVISQYIQSLKNLEASLEKAEQHAAAKKFDVGGLMTSRLAPDMQYFTYQIQSA